MSTMGKAYGVIVNNIANKLLRIAYSLVKHDSDYEANHEFLRAERMSETIKSA